MSSQSGATFINQPIANNLTLFPLNPLNYREDIVRLDYRITDNQTTYFRWLQDSNTLLDPFGTFSNSGILNTTPTNRSRPGESLLLAETWVISPTIVNEARANATWVSQHIVPAGTTPGSAVLTDFNFLSSIRAADIRTEFPPASITNYAGFQGPNFALMSPTTDISFGDTISVQLGAHSLKAGVTVARDRVDQNGRPYYTGNLSFNTSGNNMTTGNALADALLGNFRSYTEASADPVGFFRFTQPMAFVQDSWKVNRKLSVELGLRYEYVQPMYTQANNMANFDQSLFNPAQAVKTHYCRHYYSWLRAILIMASSAPGAVSPPTSKAVCRAPPALSFNRFPPVLRAACITPPIRLDRVSVLPISSVRKTVMRGGYGIFYNRPEGNVTFSQVNVPPILQITEFDNGNLSNPAGGAPANTLPIGSISAINPKLKTSYVEQFSYGIQQELPYAIFLETTYVGGLGRHLLREPNINFPNLAAVAANPSYNTNYFVPYPGYTTLQQYQSDSTSNYHALQVFVSKRAGSGDLHQRLHVVEIAGRFQWRRRQFGRLSKPPLQLRTHFLRSPPRFRRNVYLEPAAIAPDARDRSPSCGQLGIERRYSPAERSIFNGYRQHIHGHAAC